MTRPAWQRRLARRSAIRAPAGRLKPPVSPTQRRGGRCVIPRAIHPAR
ncbi:hypothetical protein BSIN_0566 [Burkholderia singularis]|uniref:Uncharacterized protein n=1 Tax=Burkholderia singularis TaxID=1503053 RepID=A0A238H820_9BURK|nr:hypothetical protein BSIN_0566 [Burkholderia singularis]